MVYLKILIKSISKLWIYLGLLPALLNFSSFYFPNLIIPKFISWKLSILIVIILFVIAYIIEYRKLKKELLKEEENNDLIKSYKEREKELLKENEKLNKELGKKEKKFFNEIIKNKEWETVINSLKNKSLSKENIIKKYSSGLFIILFQYSNQKINNKNNSFIRNELEERYNVKSLGGALKVIPPKSVPKNIKNGEDLKNWFKKSIQSKYKNSSCIISVLGILDLKNVYWKNDYSYDTKYKTIGSELGLDDIFESEEISKILSKENISVIEPILDGDIAFLCSLFLTDKEMKTIYENQIEIEKELNLSLIDLTYDYNSEKIKSIFSNYFNKKKSENITNRLITEAKYWHSKLLEESKNG